MIAAIHSDPKMYHEIKELPEYNVLTRDKQKMLTEYYENITAKQPNPAFQENIELTPSPHQAEERAIERTSSEPTHGGYTDPIGDSSNDSTASPQSDTLRRFSSAPTSESGGFYNPIDYVLTSIQSTLTSSSPEVDKE